jgi:hypothetical protein
MDVNHRIDELHHRLIALESKVRKLMGHAVPAPADPDDVVDAPHPAAEAAAGAELHLPVMRSANPIPRDGFTYKDEQSKQEDKEADTNA